MRNKGFTLIELLAVIVILAIIALIATPIVLGIIEDTRESSNEISAGYIIDSVEKAYSIAYTQNNGALPTLEQVRDQFKMSNAEWVGDKITAAKGEVECIVTTQGDEFSISCPGFESIKPQTIGDVATATAEAQG